MSAWEAPGASDEWYTPSYIFDALGEEFDLDVAAPYGGGPHVPAKSWHAQHGLEMNWYGFVWMNPPFGGRNGIAPWLERFFQHRNGIALTPDRTSAAWWQNAMAKADAVLLIAGKVKFEKPDGTLGKQPSTGTSLFASGARAVSALANAQHCGLGVVLHKRAGK